MTLPQRSTIFFPAGLPGFEACRRFVLMYSDDVDPGVCLKGIDEPSPAFFLMDPRRVSPGYACQLSPADRARLGAVTDHGCVWLVMVSLSGNDPRVNLRAPIVINPATMRGIQVVPADTAGPADVAFVAATEAACSS
jgi:flagellar assembly factor FliW